MLGGHPVRSFVGGGFTVVGDTGHEADEQAIHTETTRWGLSVYIGVL